MSRIWGRVIVCLAAGLSAGAASAAQNALVNPEFITGLTGWKAQTGAGIYWVHDNADGFPAAGSVFGLNVRTGVPNASIVMTQCVPVSSLVTQYALHGIVRVNSNQGAVGLASLNWNYYPTADCSGTTNFATYYSMSIGDTRGQWWMTSTPAAMVPIGAKAALVRLMVLKESSSGSFAAWFDHVYFGSVSRTKGDFDRDGKTDLILRQYDGTWSNQQIWLMDGVTRMGTPWPMPMHMPLGDWKLVGTDDFTSDDQQDLVFQNAPGGSVFIAVLDGNAMWGGPVFLPNLPGPNWAVEAVAKFDGDDRPDLLWRNTATGELLVWTMNGLSQSGTIIPNPSQGPDLNWRVVGARDFNGDLRPDLLWYNNVSGKLVLWFMDAGVNRIAGQFVNPDAAGDANWKVVATGDYGVGPGGINYTNDIVWRNDVSGKLVVWYMDKAGNRTSGSFTSPDSAQPDPLAWTVAGPR